MQTEIYLAELWGFSLVILSLGFLLRPKSLPRLLEVCSTEGSLLLLGVLNTVLGIAHILAYNTWDSGWKTIITLLGWLLFIRGVVILAFPSAIARLWGKIRKNMDWLTYVLVGLVVVGCFLLYAAMSW